MFGTFGDPDMSCVWGEGAGWLAASKIRNFEDIEQFELSTTSKTPNCDLSRLYIIRNLKNDKFDETDMANFNYSNFQIR